MTLTETCDKLRDHLQKWYDENKNGLGWASHLYYVKQEFFKENNCEEHESNIRADFRIVPNSYKRGFPCLNGCCSFEQTAAHSKTNGIVVEPMDWGRANYLSKYENIKPINWDRKSYLDKCQKVTLKLEGEINAKDRTSRCATARCIGPIPF